MQDTIKITGSFTIEKIINNQVVWSSGQIKNSILTAGLSEIPKLHTGQSTDIEIVSLEIGDGDTAVTVADTALDNMVLDDIPRSNQSLAGTGCNLTFFINDTELANGTYRELGLRLASGDLFTRALILPVYTKASNEDTRISYTINYSIV